MDVNFAFDRRIASRYRDQRQHPADVSAEIGQTIARLVGAGNRVLEIGVGTGRIALPVAEAGCRVAGFDLSAEMLREAEPPVNLTLLQADMHQMPFQRATFAGAMVIHVLHLTRAWQAVLTQAADCLQPGGLLIRGEDWTDPDSVVGKLRDELRRLAIEMAPQMKPPSAGASRDQFLSDIGFEPTETVIAAEWQVPVSPAERLSVIEQRMDAQSWILPDAVFDPLFERLKAFSAETWPDQAAVQQVTRRFVLKLNRKR